MKALSETVLLVDDHEDFLASTTLMLKYMGYQVLSSTNGSDALSLLQSGSSVDILLADVIMPKMDGIALVEEARRLQSSLKVALTSVFPGHYLKTNGKDFGSHNFLEKPYGMGELYNFLRGL